MVVKKSRPTYFPLPGKAWFHRAGLLLMAVSALALMVMSKTRNPGVEKLRGGITDVMAPVLETVARPLDALHDAGAWVTDMSRLRAENTLLRNRNIQLLRWQAAARDMEDENRSLRALLNVLPAEKNHYVTARVVSDLGGPYVHSALIDGGSAGGIRKDQAVINENGLVGRIVDVGASSARVLLLTDINSRIPVIAERANEKSILAGNNSALPSLSYLSGDSRISVGDRIVTSGDGGVFPKGIPVGIVTSVDKEAVSVQPFVDPSRVEYVSVIDYAF
ncbi:MAG: rod shape-determining protein MreC [Pseudomonadota bacterium]|nr:rod shape-determining protein MreC [Pseudomonadota bacterium]MDE3037260.1 rod shape-determining protein MreC [Pseudomonadota bacterium]